MARRDGGLGWRIGGLADRSLGTVVLAHTHKQSGLSHTSGLSGLCRTCRRPAPGAPRQAVPLVPGSQPSSTLHFFLSRRARAVAQFEFPPVHGVCCDLRRTRVVSKNTIWPAVFVRFTVDFRRY